MQIKSICVYCGSSSQVNRAYFSEAIEFGKTLANHGITLIYGAGNQGLMGTLANSVLEYNGTVVGIIPQFMVDADWCHKSLSKLHITSSMHERKQLMSDLSDAAVALPGGIGTFEELFEIITWKQLGLTTKPIVIVNINGYFDHIIAMLEQAVNEKFMREIHRKMWVEVKSTSEILKAISESDEWDSSARKIAAI